MIKIGTLTCLHSNNVCARVGCLKAFQNRSDFFEDILRIHFWEQ